ncbi:unnamed protein product [Rotaria magnacalcarata]
MSESTKLKNLLNKVKPSIQLEVRKKKPKTTVEFLEYAKEVEELLQLSSTNIDTHTNCDFKPTNIVRSTNTSSNLSSYYSSNSNNNYSSTPYRNSRTNTPSYTSASHKPEVAITSRTQPSHSNYQFHPKKYTLLSQNRTNNTNSQKQKNIQQYTNTSKKDSKINSRSVNAVVSPVLSSECNNTHTYLSSITCQICNQLGHDALSCPSFQKEPKFIRKDTHIGDLLSISTFQQPRTFYSSCYKSKGTTKNLGMTPAFSNLNTIRNFSSREKISTSSKLYDPNVINYLHSLVKDIENKQQKQDLLSLLLNFYDIFDITKHNIARTPKSHVINTIPHSHPSSRSYPQPDKEEAMYKLIQEFLAADLISQSNSPYAAPAILVKKKYQSYRLVVDYKRLNAITIKDSSPLPNMEDTVSKLGKGFCYFSKLDLKSGFYQIPIDDNDKEKTASITPFGLYQFNVLPMGLRNSPPTFQKVMTDMLKSCHHLKQVFSALQSKSLVLNPPKCEIAVRQIDYLGHTITKDCIKPIRAKIDAILNIEEPRTLAQANRFLGSLGWYRKFLPKFADIAAQINAVTNLTKSNRRKFKWENPQSQAFRQLKQMLITEPLFLHYPVDDLPLILTIDASDIGRSIIIMTDHCPLCYIMQKSIKNTRVNRIIHLIQEYNIDKTVHTQGRYNCLPDYLSRYSKEQDDALFNIDYGLASKNKSKNFSQQKLIAAMTLRPRKKQAITRNDHQSIENHNIIFQQFDTLSQSEDIKKSKLSSNLSHNYFDIAQLKIEQQRDSQIQNIVQNFSLKSTKNSFLSKEDTVYKLISLNKYSHKKIKVMYLPTSMIQSLLRASHDDPMSGSHFATNRILCTQFNLSRAKKYGHLRSISPPEEPLALISIDFCEPLLRTPRENQYVLVITDYFTRHITALALPNCTAETTARALFDDFFCKFGIPSIILSDRGIHFQNNLMENLQKLIGYNHIYSTAYHPQTNGVVERFNATQGRIIITRCLPCIKPSNRFSTITLLRHNIDIYNQLLLSLSTKYNVLYFDLSVPFEWLSRDRIHLHHDYHDRFSNITINYLHDSNVHHQSSNNIKYRSREAIRRRNRKKNLKFKQIQQNLIIGRDITSTWSYYHVKNFLRSSNIHYARLVIVSNHALRLHFNNSLDILNADQNLPHNIFDSNNFISWIQRNK